ncbi:response regulator transcription factor [Candidatus Soleaferrea massiliensis]|uniref:response regulator transcription factor n=1 Tax=Candidatus Soleaferrea massiliensis TaxID=1470354 RepID=UPI00058F0836|nr:response regulator transcription factor [Candidatus Soleaferrea massiliensis]
MKIVIVEDHPKIREELSTFLSRNGYTCVSSDDFEHIIAFTLEQHADLVLLDINLPVYDGYYVCREIRRQSEVPIIVVTSRDSEMDELMSMNLGADDYITKPYNTQILLLRIASVLRRAQKNPNQELLDCGGFVVNLSRSTVETGGDSIEITKNELKILSCLYAKKGCIVSRDELMKYLWDSDAFVDDNTLTVTVNRLRRKLETAGVADSIQTKRGQGYLLL